MFAFGFLIGKANIPRMLTVETFKMFCMKSGTKGRRNSQILCEDTNFGHVTTYNGFNYKMLEPRILL